MDNVENVDSCNYLFCTESCHCSIILGVFKYTWKIGRKYFPLWSHQNVEEFLFFYITGFLDFANHHETQRFWVLYTIVGTL
jgi:hypothetical protein